VPALPALAFTRAAAGYYDITGEGGALLRAMPGAAYHPALCAGHKMSTGRHAAEFTVLETPPLRQGWLTRVMIGVAQEGIDITREQAFVTPLFWGIGNNFGRLHHHGTVTTWGEKNTSFGKGDVVELLLDCDAGTLAAKKNGKWLGVAATGLKRLGVAGLAGEFCWAAALKNDKNAVRVRAVDADAF
jgi:hypothetical protein